jgi:lipid-A-disaccharide synthase
MKKIYLIAGEASGDNIGAKLMQALKEKDSELEFYGIGGDKMAKEGMKILFPSKEISIMGFFEVILHIFFLLKKINQTVEDIVKIQPDIIVTIDSPGFCFRVAKAVKNLVNCKLVHYVAPTVWAYKPERAKKIAKIYDHLLVILPFETKYFEAEGLKTSFVGHPAIESLKIFPRELLRNKFNVDKNSLILCLAPGSRLQEIKTLLPIFFEAVKLINAEITIAIPTHGHLKNTIIECNKENLPLILVDEEDKESLFSAADLVLTKSGTITTELAFYNAPMVVAHKINNISYFLLKQMIKIKYVTIINLLAEKQLIPELLQKNCEAKIIAEKLASYLTFSKTEDWKEEMRVNLEKLQCKGEVPSQLAARIVLSLM